jgi:exopolysaccharide production protein ExoQ
MSIRFLLKKYTLLAFMLSLSIGQYGSIPLANSSFLYLHDIVLVVLMLLSLPDLWNARHLKMLRPLVLFLIVIGISIVSVFPVTPIDEYVRGSLYALRLLCYSTVPILIAASVWKKEQLQHMLVFTGAITVMFGFLQLLFFPSLKPLVGAGWDEHLNRMFGTMFDPNFFGMLAVLTYVMSCSFIFTWNKKRSHVKLNSWIFAVILSFVAVVLTYSRSAYAALVLSSLLFFIKIKQTRVVMFFCLALLGLYLLIPQGPMDMNRITRVVSTVSRIQNWQTSIQYISERPLLGYGFNMLRSRIGQDLPVNQHGIVSRDRSGLDSSMLFVFATTGLVGGVVFLWWIVSQVYVYATHQDHIFGTAALSSLTGALIFSMFNNGLFYPWILIWLMTLFGLAMRKD